MRHVVEFVPKNANAYSNWGSALLDLKKPQGAIGPHVAPPAPVLSSTPKIFPLLWSLKPAAKMSVVLWHRASVMSTTAPG